MGDNADAPKKLTQFERQKQEAEAKRLREEAETAAALRAYEDDFGANDDEDPISRIASGKSLYNDAPTGPRRSGLGAGSRGGSGQGSDGARRGLNPSFPGLKRKREDDWQNDRRGSSGLGRSGSGLRGRGVDFMDDEDEAPLRDRRSPEEAVSRPTILLEQLQPDCTVEDVRKLLARELRAEDVEISESKNSRKQRTRTALVAMSATTSMGDIDNAVSTLRGKYLGSGCYLSISRHRPCTADLRSLLNSVTVTESFEPFGAKEITGPPPIPGYGFRNAPPPGSYGQASPMPKLNRVSVVPPSDIKQMKMIHNTAEKVVEYGPEFEALLMSRREIQQDEKWAWLFDSSLPASVYYRWCIWRWCSMDESRLGDEAGKPPPPTGPDNTHVVFENGPLWQAPGEKSKFEHVTEITDFIEDDDYVSSDDESGDDNDPRRPNNQHSGPPPTLEGMGGDDRVSCLNPYKRAKMTHLLARLPDSIATLRIGDVARVTSFVLNNASSGAEEIVDMMLTNIEHPFRDIVSYNSDDDDEEDEDGDVENTNYPTFDPDDPPTNNMPSDNPDPTSTSQNSRSAKDNSPAKLVALYLISDTIQAAATSGLKDAWRYRSLFESALQSRQVFAQLGRLEKQLSWGRLKSEQWKRKISALLTLWEERSVFPADAQKRFREEFNEPPLSARERRERDREETKKVEEEKEREAGRFISTEEASKMRDVEEEKKDKERREREEKIRLMKERVAKMNGAKSGGKDEATEANGEVKTSGPRRNRPTAADLSEAPPEERVEAKRTTAAAPPSKPGGFGFSMSLGNGPAKPAPPKQEVKQTKPEAVGDMFAGSDEEA